MSGSHMGDWLIKHLRHQNTAFHQQVQPPLLLKEPQFSSNRNHVSSLTDARSESKSGCWCMQQQGATKSRNRSKHMT